jgi:replicative DNA helicase Mcm
LAGRWDNQEHENNNNNNDNENNGWTPKHHESPHIDHSKIYSVSEASRLHKGKNVTVAGVISGIQPMRKMIKCISRKCIQCNTAYERKYDKPEFFESRVPFESINKCLKCNSKDFLGAPEYENVNAVIVELKDKDTFSEIDPLRIIVFGDDEPAYDSTINIDRHAGEIIQVTGDIFTVNISKRSTESKMVAYLYVSGLVKYPLNQELEITSEDVKAIKRFVNHVGQNNVIDKLAEMFATSIIGNNFVKKGLLLTAASTSTDKTSKKLHDLLIGDPGLAKSELLRAATKLVPNSRFENVQFATGKSLTAIVTKEEGDALILRIGPIPQAKGAIAALNEIGRMTHDDQAYMLDTMQEQEFTTNKFGQNFHINSPTAVIASANPMGGSWKSYGDVDEKIDLDKIPMIKPLIDRFDLIFTFKDNRDENILTEYARKKSEMEDTKTPDYDIYLAKHIMYAKQRYPKPTFSEEAKAMLNQFYVGIRLKYGSPRIRDTLYRIAQNIARLKLKHEVDAHDATETMQFYNMILQNLNMVITLPSNPREVAYHECLYILKQTGSAISYEELISMAGERNTQVSKYLGTNSKLRNNIKLRSILEMLQNHSRIKTTQMKPIVLQYIAVDGVNESINNGTACDPCDACDTTRDTLASNLEDNNGPNNFAGISETLSHRSHTSHSIDIDNGNGNGHMFSCYYCEKIGGLFETANGQEYRKHCSQKHYNKPAYPNMATIKVNGLKPQGKQWET